VKVGVAAVLASLVALAAAGSATAAISVRIDVHARDHLVTGNHFHVDVRTGRKVARPHVELRGRDVSAAFRRAGQRRWVADLGRTGLATGANDLSVSVRAPGAGRGFAVARVYRGRHRPGLLGMIAPVLSVSSPTVRVKLARKPDLLFDALLNGKPVAAAFGRGFGTSRAARLSPSYGLRYGLNVLRIRAARSDGSFDAERRRIRVPRNRPLAAAGRDRVVRGRRAVRLDGTASLATSAAAGLGYQWKLISKPPGSKAKLRGAAQPRPSFRPDVPGAYRFRLKVVQHGGGPLASRTDSDTMVLTSGKSVPPIGLPLNTLANPAGEPGISYDGQIYPVNFPEDAVQLMIIDRTTGEVIHQVNLAGTSQQAATVLKELEGLTAQKPLVVVSINGLGSKIVSPSFNSVIKFLTGSEEPANVINGQGITVIGIPGSPTAAWIDGGWSAIQGGNLHELPGSLDGYLQLDNTGHLAFTPATRIALNSAAAGAPSGQNTISIGAANYPSGALQSPAGPGATCATGGFQVQAVGAEYLEAGLGKTFTTSGCGAAADQLGQQQMAQFLQSRSLFETEGSQLIAIQSIGNPRGSDASNWGELANAIAGMGGNRYVFEDIPAGSGNSYALLAGESDPNSPLPGFKVVESSQAETGKPAHLTAVLKQSRLGYVGADEASPTNPQFQFGLSLLAYQPEEGPAFPDASSGEDKTALAYIAEKVIDLPEPRAGTSCYVPARPDVRSEYCNPNVTDKWASTDTDGYTYKLEHAAYPGAVAGFSEATWNSLQCDFIGRDCGSSPALDEWGAISQVWSDFTELKQFVLASSSVALADANQTAQNVRDSINASSAPATGTWLDVFSNVLGGFTYLGISEIEAAAGLVSTVGFLAEDGVNSAEGSPLLGKFETTASGYVSDLSATFTNSYTALDHTRDLILTGESKLQQMSNGDYVPGNLDESVAAITLGVARFSYETLLPAAYQLDLLERFGVNSEVKNAREYECGDAELETTYKAFPNEPDGGQWLPTGGPLYALSLRGSPLPDEDEVKPPTPTAELMEPLFKPYATDSTNLIPTQFNFSPASFFPSVWNLGKAPVVSC
jgi:hypothetical protein